MTDFQRSRWSMSTIVIVALMCLAGCSIFYLPPGETPPPTIIPSSTTVPSLSPESQTLTLCPASPSRTPTLHPTRTPRPTLTAEEEYAYVQEMLATNGGCELPCWWGITPGESNWRDANDQLPYLNFQFWFPENFIGYAVHLSLTKGGDFVQFIKARGDCFIEECDHFTQDWSRYSLDQVLTRYSVPSRASLTLALPVEPGGPIYYDLYVFYDDLGFGIRYDGDDVVEQGELLHTCFSFDYITLWLQSPESPTSLDQAINPDEWSFAVPIDEATGMSVEEFYETFRQPGACLEAPPTFQ